MDQINITFTDFDKLKKIVESMATEEQLPIQVLFKQRSELICFLYVISKKLGPSTASLLMFINLI